MTPATVRRPGSAHSGMHDITMSSCRFTPPQKKVSGFAQISWVVSSCWRLGARTPDPPPTAAPIAKFQFFSVRGSLFSKTDGMRCHLAETLAWSQVLDRGPCPPREGEIWGRNPCSQRCCSLPNYVGPCCCFYYYSHDGQSLTLVTLADPGQ